MRLLVTGGAGFIGSNFVRRSLKLRPNLRITVLDALTYAGRLGNLDHVLPNIEFIHGNILDRNLVDELVSETDGVIHFAAESHNDNSLLNPEAFIDTNIYGTFNLIQSAVKYCKRFHHVSTDEVFGDLPLTGEQKFTLNTPYSPSSPYSASKASSDHLVRAWIRSFGLNATISNCSNNFGPYQHEEKLIPRTILLAKAGIRPKIYGDGKNVRDWIHVNDHTDGIWAILERGKVGCTYLLGTDNQRSNLEVVSTILKIMGLSDDFIEFVSDRPGHDLRYAIDSTLSCTELNWNPGLGAFETQLPEVVKHYLELDIDISTISNSGLSNRSAPR